MNSINLKEAEERSARYEIEFKIKKLQTELGSLIDGFFIKVAPISRACSTSLVRLKYCLEGKHVMPLEFVTTMEKLEPFKSSPQLKDILLKIKLELKRLK